MTKMIRLHQFGDMTSLSLDNVTLPPLQANEVKIQVKATGLSPDQLSYIAGNFHPDEPRPQLPVTLGYEAAGVVTEVGDEVTKDWIGTRVAPVGPYDFVKYGSLGDEIIVPADRLAEIPDQLSFAEAAALWVPYLTAFPVFTATLQPTDNVLITAATSTVGHAAIEYAKMAGATVIGTTRSAQKATALKAETSIDHVIVTSPETNLALAVQKLTGPSGIQLAFDAIGGPDVALITQTLGTGGRLIEYGVIGGLVAPLPVSDLLSKGLTIEGFTVNEIVAQPNRRHAAVSTILAAIKANTLHPKVSAQFPLTDFKQAFAALKTNDNIGRIVLTN